MQVEKELAELALDRDALLTIGVFDGVHLGHRYLLAQLKERARERGLLSGAITFRQLPEEILSPANKPLYLTDLDEKVALLKNEGADALIILSFTLEMAKLSAREFLSLLKKHLKMQGLIVGPDFVLGKNGGGTIDVLSTLGKEMGFTIEVIPPVKMNGDVVSSTAIRNALAKGDMGKVRRMMGRPFGLHGRVVRGTGRGMKLGFPTANIDVAAGQALPADGVYATFTLIDGTTYPSMTNVGRKPTFDSDGSRTVEVYVLDYHKDLYGHEIKVDFIERLRAEKCFAGAEELKKQIAEDVKRGKSILAAEVAAKHA